MIKSRFAAASALLFLSTGSVGCVHHAPASVPGGPAALEGVLEQARVNFWYARITTRDATVEGKIELSAEGHVGLGNSDIAMADITRVERRHRSLSGALPGALIGGTALGSVAWWAGGLEENPRGEGGRIVLTGTSVALGAVGGFLLGRKLYPGQDRWVTVWATTR